MQRFLISIKDAEDIDGASCFIDGKHDQVREALHRFAANVSVTDGGGGRQVGDAVKILGHQVGKAVAKIDSDQIIVLDRYCDIISRSIGSGNLGWFPGPAQWPRYQ